MRNEKDLRYKETIKLETEKAKYTRKCPYCGWKNEITNKYHRVPCKNCGNMVYLHKRDEFKYKLKGILKNEKN